MTDDIEKKDLSPKPPTIRLDIVRSRSEKLRTITNIIRAKIIKETYERAPNARVEAKLYDTTKYLLARLYRASCVSPDCCLGVPRGNDHYNGASRLGRLHFTNDITLRVIDWLEASGYVKKVKDGVRFETPHYWYDDKEVTGYVTAYRPTQKLIDLFHEHEVNLQELAEDIDPADLVELRNEEGEIVNLPQDEIVKQSQVLLVDYNKLLQASYIDWDEVPGVQPKEPPDKCDKLVRRIYSRDLLRGGRFYGGFWQRLPEREMFRDKVTGDKTVKETPRRLFLYINAELTTEIDFRAIHPTLLYVKEGLDLRQYAEIKNGIPDLYHKLVFSNDAAKDRRLAKKAFLIGLNAETPKSQYAALRNEIAKDRGSYPHFDSLDDAAMQSVIERIYATHPALKGYFGSGIGLTLQNYDSLIAERVIAYFTYKLKVPVLSLHDSFIVPATYYKELAYAMYDAFNEVAQLINHEHKIKYEITDILDFSNTDLASQYALAGKLNDPKVVEKFAEEEKLLAELAELTRQIFDEDGIRRPIQDREDEWRRGNILPFYPSNRPVESAV